MASTIHQRIKQRREALGLTKTGLAEKVGVSYQTVSQWETEPDPDSLKVLSTAPKRERLAKVAEALGVTEEWLMTGRGPDGLPEDPLFKQAIRFWEGMTPEARDAWLQTGNTLYNLSQNQGGATPADPFNGKEPPKK